MQLATVHPQQLQAKGCDSDDKAAGLSGVGFAWRGTERACAATCQQTALGDASELGVGADLRAAPPRQRCRGDTLVFFLEPSTLLLRRLGRRPKCSAWRAASRLRSRTRTLSATVQIRAAARPKGPPGAQDSGSRTRGDVVAAEALGTAVPACQKELGGEACATAAPGREVVSGEVGQGRLWSAMS